MNDDITTIPERLREAAEDLPRMENKEDYWRVYNLMRNAADRIESLQAQLDAREYLDASAREVVRQIKPGTAKAIAAGHDRALGMGPDDIADEDEP